MPPRKSARDAKLAEKKKGQLKKLQTDRLQQNINRLRDSNLDQIHSLEELICRIECCKYHQAGAQSSIVHRFRITGKPSKSNFIPFKC